MKLEIEITEEELRSAIERKVRTAVADQTNHYGTDAYIKDQVKAHWKNAVDAMVADVLKDSKTLREKIAAELEKKLRAQLAAALKNAAYPQVHRRPLVGVRVQRSVRPGSHHAPQPDDARDARMLRLLRDGSGWPAVFASSDAPEPLRGDELIAALSAHIKDTK